MSGTLPSFGKEPGGGGRFGFFWDRGEAFSVVFLNGMFF